MPLLPLQGFEFHHRLAATAGPAIVLFTAPACGACRRLHRVLEQGEWGGVTLFRVDAEREAALVQEFEISRFPSLHLYRDGNYHAAIEAGATPERLQFAIAAALDSPAQEAP